MKKKLFVGLIFMSVYCFSSEERKKIVGYYNKRLYVYSSKSVPKRGLLESLHYLACLCICSDSES